MKKLIILAFLGIITTYSYAAGIASQVNESDLAQESLVKSYIDEHKYTAAINVGESSYASSKDSKIALYLGKAYFLKQNYQKAVNYFSEAATKNEALAMLTLGNLYGSGVGVGQDYTKAVYWYKKAVAKGNTQAMNYLGLIYRDGVSSIRKDPKSAFDLFIQAADLGNDEGYFNLGYMYQNGLGVEQNTQIALNNYIKAANLGSILAMDNLGYIYENGAGVKQNYKEAFNWYMLAAAKSDGAAECKVGEYYFNGTGTDKDYKFSKTWFLRGQKHGCKVASSYLAKLNELEKN